jgi:hypothetical protein
VTTPVTTRGSNFLDSERKSLMLWRTQKELNLQPSDPSLALFGFAVFRNVSNRPRNQFIISILRKNWNKPHQLETNRNSLNLVTTPVTTPNQYSPAWCYDKR